MRHITSRVCQFCLGVEHCPIVPDGWLSNGIWQFGALLRAQHLSDRRPVGSVQALNSSGYLWFYWSTVAGQISVYIQCSFVHRNDVWSAHTIWINLGLGFTQPWVTSVRVAHRINDPFHPLHWHTHSIHLRIYNQENDHRNKKHCQRHNGPMG